MSDQNDLASDIEQAQREAALAKTRAAARMQFATECRHCGDDLEAHRQTYGSCIDCQTRIEKQQKQGIRCAN
ncbi:hypothetical protein [Chitinibacter sp. S2-10]|uniref:hypothetical protein n=1 Tax=Chitinibacter sp. S2-10 TaxID=3373597 RepID=UPI0039774115